MCWLSGSRVLQLHIFHFSMTLFSNRNMILGYPVRASCIAHRTAHCTASNRNMKANNADPIPRLINLNSEPTLNQVRQCDCMPSSIRIMVLISSIYGTRYSIQQQQHQFLFARSQYLEAIKQLFLSAAYRVFIKFSLVAKTQQRNWNLEQMITIIKIICNSIIVRHTQKQTASFFFSPCIPVCPSISPGQANPYSRFSASSSSMCLHRTIWDADVIVYSQI